MDPYTASDHSGFSSSIDIPGSPHHGSGPGSESTFSRHQLNAYTAPSNVSLSNYSSYSTEERDQVFPLPMDSAPRREALEVPPARPGRHHLPNLKTSSGFVSFDSSNESAVQAIPLAASSEPVRKYGFL